MEEYTQELYQKGLNDLDNHDGVVTPLEMDILECEVKWALGTLLPSKLVEGMEFQLFKNLKDDIVKVLHLMCQQIWKTEQ